MNPGAAQTHPLFDVVVPTIGRQSLARLLSALDDSIGPRPGRLVVVDDRPSTRSRLPIPALSTLETTVVVSGARGPAAARNAGWRQCSAPWIAFLDDDVIPSPAWWAALAVDLAGAGHDVVAVAGTVAVPLPAGRPPTDAERNVTALASATWITADMAVRRAALVACGGFDERFPRAYREDTELALRLVSGGGRITSGSRTVDHPVRQGSWNTSIRAQRGNADDMLMRRLHGPDWRTRGYAPAGRLRSHIVTTLLASTVATVAVRAPRARRVATLAAAVTGARIGRFWWQRVRPGPRSMREWGRMAISSIVIPFAATGWAIVGWVRARRLAPRGRADRWTARPPCLVLFDRDGTLVDDVPYNGDPSVVTAVPDARCALDRLRAHDVRIGLITNQSGVARGLLNVQQVDSVNRRVAGLLGPFDTVQVCTHGPDDGCTCRKPATGLVLAALGETGVHPHDCAVVGDIAADVEAGLRVGARSILVPNAVTRTDEISWAPEVARDLASAVDALLSGRALDADVVESSSGPAVG